MINLDYYLVLIKGEDKTADILSWKYEKDKPVVWVTYNSGKAYPYKTRDFLYYKSTKAVEITNKIVLKKNMICHNVNKAVCFDNIMKLFYESGYTEIVPIDNVRIISSALDNPTSKNCFEYYKQIAKQIGLTTDEGHNILASSFEKIDFIRNDSIVSDFLSGNLSNNTSKKSKTVIFPFGFNISQKAAVENALNNMLSIIEGPPGTGKTQTILNIIANAVMRNESVAVVSSNNAATFNVYEKLKKHNIDFIAASLGNKANKDEFLESQNVTVSNISDWCLTNERIISTKSELLKSEQELDKMLLIKNQTSILSSERDSLKKEYEHFKDSLNQIKNVMKFSRLTPAQKVLELSEELKLNKPHNDVFSKIKLFFRYGVVAFNFTNLSAEKIEDYCQNEYYIKKIYETEKRLKMLSKKLDLFDFDSNMKSYAEKSMKVFKAKMEKRYNLRVRRKYSIDDLRKNADEFVKDYPVVLSTTYSLKSSLSNNFLYDYVIVDEASQVDLATGVLALSCAKKAIIVGDLKQLPNVLTVEQKAQTKRIFDTYKLSDEYNYAENSLLSSVTALFKDAPRILLKEHYRCNPEIIGFCNQRFYNGKLVILTESKTDKTPLLVYRTVKGNHARKHQNQRQIDVIQNEVIPNQGLNLCDESVGIVTPYRNQVDLLKEAFNGTTVKCDMGFLKAP